MSQDSLRRRLSAQDASFLYFESEEAPLHIGSIAVIEGDVPLQKVRETIRAKLPLIPRYMQRALPAPFGIGHPTWEWDPEFDITRHIIEVQLEPPGTQEQLLARASDLFAPILDRDKPLWEMYLVKGLEGGNSALVSKVHHCLVDGVSGIEILMIVFDVSPAPAPPIAKELDPFPPVPGAAQRLFDAVMDNLADGVDQFAGFQRRLAEGLLGGDDRSRRIVRALETALPNLVNPVQRAPFNRPIRAGRRVAVSEFSFAEVRAIRGAAGGTVNDVILAVLGGALGRYLEMHGQSTEGRRARILTPVNVRREDERGALGNRVSMLLVEVPIGHVDPVARLQAVRERTDRLKRNNVADGIDIIGDFLNTIPPALQALAGSLPQPANTLANMVCTNVPGPMIPLYIVGHRMIAHYPLVPLGWEMAIGCGVTSFDQKLYFGLMADQEAAAEAARLKEFLDQSFVELRAAAGVGRSEIPDLRAAPQPERVRRRRAAAATAERMAADAG